jgi:hypothetical protein
VTLFETLLFSERADVPPPAVTSEVPPYPSSRSTFPDNERILACLDGLSVDIIEHIQSRWLTLCGVYL